MKKTILTFGLISGILASILMLCTIPFFKDLEHGNNGLILGYSAIVLVALLVFFGIRSYRDNLAGGTITFSRGFLIGLGISLISCTIYVLTWEVIYFKFMSHSMDGYFAKMILKAQASPGTPEAIQAKVAAIQHSQQQYQNPFFNALYTFIEPFPVDLFITIVSAIILRKKTQPTAQPVIV
jgi:uncharacterized membrane protein (DUF485 family)